MKQHRHGVRTSVKQGRIYIQWVKALKEALDEKRPVHLLRSVMPTQSELFNDRVEGRDACGASLSHAGLAGTGDKA